MTEYKLGPWNERRRNMVTALGSLELENK